MTDASALLERLLDTPAATAPAYAGDGRLYALHDAAGSAQIWEWPADGGPPRPRTAHADACAFVAGLPDGGAIFGRDAAGDERVQLFHLPPQGEARPLTNNPAAIHGWGAVSPDGLRIAYTSNARHPAHADAWVMEIASGEARLVADVEGPHELPAWRPDGQAVILSTAPRTFESTLFLVPLDGSPREELTPHEGDARHMNPRWKSDGSGFWLLTDRGRDFLGVAFLVPGAAPQWLHVPDGDVEKLEPSPDQTMLAVAVNEGGYSSLRFLDAATGAMVSAPEHPPGVITKLAWAPDGKCLAFDLAGFSMPSGLHIARPDAPGTVTRHRAPDLPALASWDTVFFPAHDGRDLPGFLAFPQGNRPEAGWPVLVWVHGGPAMQALPNWRPDLQAILAMGIAVLVPNVRGSTGYGVAYAALDDREKRLDSVADLASAHRWLAAREDVDGTRIGVMGQSYGGWMVLAAVTEHPELWACGVDFYGIARWKTFFERTGPWRIGHRAAEYGDPVQDAELLERLSPLNRAERIRCPMLVAQGLTDPRVPPHESEQIVSVLRGRNVPVEYLTFADEGHGFTKRANRRRVYAAVTAFLRQHLLGR
ncbi:S9 family peptidase [Pseudoroseomonas globiformis]|uniref:Acyl-peptide hydrolase n=1 Tax=Teichococcus globiformis TaxID=2307229 RepID=A0ABV7FUL0_9PROT